MKEGIYAAGNLFVSCFGGWTVGLSTLDESPMVYKPMAEIVRLIEPTVEIERIIKPIYNFKAGEQ